MFKRIPKAVVTRKRKINQSVKIHVVLVIPDLPSNQGNSKISPFFGIKLYIGYSLFRYKWTSFCHWRIITEYIAPDTAVYCRCFYANWYCEGNSTSYEVVKAFVFGVSSRITLRARHTWAAFLWIIKTVSGTVQYPRKQHRGESI